VEHIVDVDFLVAGAKVQEKQWACLVLVLRLQASLRGVKDALLQRCSQVCESYLGTSCH
jgi:hypothetical protein